MLALGAAVLYEPSMPVGAIWLSAAIPAFVASCVMFLPTALIMFRIMQYVSPGLVGIFMLSEALVAALSAALFLGEALLPMQWAGVVMILATGVFVGVREGK
jgi:drug/metabolite transporter (DMT)-like permease